MSSINAESIDEATCFYEDNYIEGLLSIDDGIKEKGAWEQLYDASEIERCKSEEDKDGDDGVESGPGTGFRAVGTWGSYGVDDTAWCDKYRPVVRFKRYEELQLTAQENSGYLTDRIIASCSSYLEKCPNTGQYVLCKCVLVQKGLNDISILRYHHFLQYVDLSCNQLTDLAALGGLYYLMHLNVSRNQLTRLLHFKPPLNLTFVNFSHNNITKIEDLSAFWSIKSLDVSHNNISAIEGLGNLKYLENLNLSFNNIDRIENLDYLNIVTLNLENNKISSCVYGIRSGLKTMRYLSYVRLGHNQIDSLKLFDGAVLLQSIDMADNFISSLLEISHLRELKLLNSINFNRNPIKNHENYETVCLETVPRLKFLDGVPVTVAQKVSAKSTLCPDSKQRAAREQAQLLALAHLSGRPPPALHVVPLLVLVGPPACGHEPLEHEFAARHKHRVARLTLHTDRARGDSEPNTSYHFTTRDHFHQLLLRGEFLAVYEVFGYNYGLSQEEWSRCSGQAGRVLVVRADLHAALALRLRGFRPLLLLSVPRSTHAHRRWLAQSYETRVLNMRYPEAAVQILKRDTTVVDSDSESSIFTSSESTGAHFTTSPVTIGESDIFEEPSTEQVVYPSFSHLDCNENESYSSEIMRRVITLETMKNNCSSNEAQVPNLYYATAACNETNYDIHLEQINSTKEGFGSNLDMSCEGSTINFPNTLVEDFYAKVLELRNSYIEFHRSNPGIFYDVLYTDELESSLRKLNRIAKFALQSHEKSAHFKDIPRDDTYHRIVGHRFQVYESDIENYMKKNLQCPATNNDLLH